MRSPKWKACSKKRPPQPTFELNSVTLVEKMRRNLLELHLLQRNGEQTYELHPLIREFFAAKRAEIPDGEALQRLFFNVTVAEARRSIETPARSLIQETAIIIPHLQAAIDLAASAQQEIAVELGLSWLAGLYKAQGRYSEAESRYERSLQIMDVI